MQELRVEVVGEFTEEHAKRLQRTMYRIWERVLKEQAEQEAAAHRAEIDTLISTSS